MVFTNYKLQRLTEAMESKNLSFEQVINLINGSKVQVKKVINPTNETKLVIDYAKTLEQVIADGNYDKTDYHIDSESFPIPPKIIGKKVKVFAKIFGFNRKISSEEVISYMADEGYRPATFRELLAWGALFPEQQKHVSIAALDSVFRLSSGNHYGQLAVPLLSTHTSNDRIICLCSLSGDWKDTNIIGIRD